MLASVGHGILGQADRLFGDDLRSIAIELLHGARRAGAGMVAVRTDPDDESVTVSDDGEGLPADRAASLLTLGGGTDVASEEGRPGWLGLAALAQRGATVRSEDWSMEIPPGAFAGQADAVLTTGHQWRRGMMVTFRHQPCRTAEGRKAARAVFAEAAEAMPFDTVIDDGAVRRHRPIDLLIDGRGHWVADDTLSAEVGDCAITVGRFEDGDAAVMRRSPHDRVAWDASVVARADVLGTVARLDCEGLTAMHPVLAGPIEEALEVFRVSPPPGWWHRSTPKYVIVLEAHGQRTLATRLADREALLHGRGLAEVGKAAAEMVAALAARARRNGVPRDAALRGLAEGLGLRIPAPQIVARRPGARTVNDSPLLARHIQERGPLPPLPALVIEGGRTTFRDGGLRRDGHLVRLPPIGAVFAGLLAGATRRAPLDRLIEVALDLPGIDTAQGADLIVDGSAIPIVRDGRFDDDAIGWAWADSGRDPGPAMVRSIAMRITTRAGRTVTVPLAFAVIEASGPLASHAVLATPDARMAAVVEAWTNAHRWHDPSRQAWTAQLEAFQDEARDLLLSAR